MKCWEPGTYAVIRGVAHGRVWIAHTVTVIQDTADLLVAYLAPGAPCKIPQGLIERKYSDASTGASRWDEQDAGNWELVDWVWKQRRALILMPPGKYYAVFLFWSDETDEFECWYVNFQLPFRKTDRTIDTLDLEIDLIIEPDGSTHWKDEAEYMAGVKRGSIPANVAARVEEARKEVLSLLAARSPLFDRKWLDWKPDPGWGIPQLHPAWNRIVDPQS